MDKKTEAQNTYHNYYQDVLNQINTENAMAEQIRQFNEQQALEKKKYDEDVRQYNATFKEQQRQYNQTYALQQKQFEEDKRQFNESLKASKTSSSGGGGGSSRSYSSGGSSSKSSSKSSSSSSGAKITKTKTTSSPKTSSKTNVTADSKKAGQLYGVCSNGYQPKGLVVNGKDYGKLTMTSATTKVKNKNGKIVDQHIWKTSNGVKYIWDGQSGKYTPYSVITNR
jgi:hypothetical protein